MVNSSLNTEQKIMEAAKLVFHRRGFEGTRMQEIADEAGVNKALLHYYFRKKDSLFEAVFEDAFSQLMSKVNEIFLSDRTLKEKVKDFTIYYIDFLNANSYLPVLVLNTIYTRPDQMQTLLEKKKLVPLNIILLIKNQAKTELNAEIDPLHLFINILSLCIFPVVARPMIQSLFKMTNEEMQNFYDERKQLLPEFFSMILKNYSTL